MARNPWFSSYKGGNSDKETQRRETGSGDSVDTGQRHSGDSVGTRQRHSGDSVGTGQRHSGDSVGTRQRHSGDSVGTRQRHSGDSIDTGQRYVGGTSSVAGSSRAQFPGTSSRQDLTMGTAARTGSSSGRGPLSLSRQRQGSITNVVSASSASRQTTSAAGTSSSHKDTLSKPKNPTHTSNGSSSDADIQPPPKKRKTDEFQEPSNGEDVWDDDDDDDFAFTQADLEQMDIMTSQAISTKEESVSTTSSKTSSSKISNKTATASKTASANVDEKQASSHHPVTTVTPKSSATGTFLKPKLIFSSTSSSSTNGSIKEASHNDSSTSGSGGSRRSSSETGTSGSYPSSLSHPSSRESSLKSSSSIRSVSSGEIMPGQLTRQGSNPTQAASESSVDLSVGAFMRSPESQALKEELDKYRRECLQLKQQVEKVTLEREGEIKILRENLHKKEGEISSMKQEKIMAIDHINRAQSEKEKQLQSEVNKLNTQLQFKERDLGNMKEKIQALESRLVSDSQQTSPARSPVMIPVSPKRRKVIKEDKSPTPATGFPTQRSFMADDRSPIVPVGGPSTSRSSDITTKDAATMASMKDNKEQPTRQRKLRLKVSLNKGNLSGAALVANLIEAVPDISDTNSERGIVGLLQRKTSAMDLIPFQFDRDNKNLLSPIPNKRLNEMKHNISTDSTEISPLVSQDSYNLALEGLSCLLHEHGLMQRRPTVTSTNILSDIESSVDSSLSSDSGTSAVHTFLSSHNGAVYFMPLLNDYLSHYIDMLTTSVTSRVTKSPSTPKSSSSSSKGSSDIESVTSSIEMLLRNSSSYANNLEHLAFVALRILHKLVTHCGSVRDVILSRGASGGQSDGEGTSSDVESSTKEMSSMETDKSHCGSSSKFSNLQILHKLFRLANPGYNDNNVHVTEKALDVLAVLASHASENDVDRLLPAMNDGMIVNGLERQCDCSIVLRSVELLKSLVKHNKMLKSLCSSAERTESEGCILYSLYSVCIQSVEKMADADFISLACKVVELLLCTQSVSGSGVSILTNEDCDCSLEVVKCIVLTLHRLLNIYEQTSDISLIETLRGGLLLLHMIWQKEESLVDYHNQVEYQYIRLICGLDHVFKQLKDKNFDSDINILHDLWDFNQDDSELSHDSEDPDAH